MATRRRSSARLKRSKIGECTSNSNPPPKKQRIHVEDSGDHDPEEKSNDEQKCNDNKSDGNKGKQVKKQRKKQQKKWDYDELFRLVKFAHEGQFFTSGVLKGYKTNVNDIIRDASLD